MGLPTAFIRLTGCPLRCAYCDTAYAFQGGRNMTLPQILDAVADYGTSHVMVTGGEPLAQKNCHALLAALCDAGYDVSLETSGAIPIAEVDARVAIIMDIKTPGSGESGKNLWSNVQHLRSKDEVKFVLNDHEDYLWAKQQLAAHGLAQKCPVLFSPVHGQLDPTPLAEWILQDKLPVRMQIQLHKLLWGEVPGK